jgi:hypothetical protein
MKKLILLLSVTLLSSISFGQNDTTTVVTDTTSSFEFYAGAVIASRNYARGVNFGSGPSLQPYAGVVYKNFTLDFFGAISGNGAYDYGTTTDFSLSYENKGFKVGVHDYYFISKFGNNNYFFETGSDMMNGHYYELQALYSNDNFSLLAAHNFYNTNLKVDNVTAGTVYLEGKYNVNEKLSIVIAGVTGPSIVNFYDAAGFTTIGLNWNREISLGNDLPATLDAKVHVNPNYKNISPGVQQAPMNFFVSLTF